MGYQVIEKNGVRVINPFVLQTTDYRRNIDMFSYATEQYALYLQIMTGDPYEKCLAFVKQAFSKDGRFQRNAPQVLVLSRHTEANREKEVIDFDDLLKDVVTKDRIMSPSMAVYHPPKVKRSIVAMFIRENVGLRGKAKKEMFAADRAGNKILEAIKDGEQGSYKTSNNSLSGAQLSQYTTLWLRSAHSSLTSTCRTSAAYANANNEKLLHGNRHYYNPEVVTENIVAIIYQTDLPALERVMTKYCLAVPTVQQCWQAIERSAQFYGWINEITKAPIMALLERCSGLQRAAFLYTGDLYQVAQYNSPMMREFITKWIVINETDLVDNPDDYYATLNSDTTAYICSLCAHLTLNRDFKTLKEADPNAYRIVATRIRDMHRVMEEYADFIYTIMTTSVVPHSVAMFTEATRRAGVVSDTDSTIFTVQNWVKWYTGEISINRTANAVRNVTIFFASQSIIHVLAMMSANMGVVREQLHQLAMKNEFAFPVFGLTSMAKHYFALQAEREGLVYDVPKMEIKGVGMKNSKAPARVSKASKDFVKRAMNQILHGGKVDIIPELKKIGDLEREIFQQLKEGKSELLSKMEIKPADNYPNPNKISTPYGYHMFWEAVFAPKYGHAPEPTYRGIKVSLDAGKASSYRDWVAQIEDAGIRERLRLWLIEHRKIGITTMVVPEQVADRIGIPQELVLGMNLRKLVYTTMSTFYLELEPFGFYFLNQNLTRLVSDHY